MSDTFLWIISVVLSSIPVVIWLYILFSDRKKEKKLLALMFSGGIIAVLSVFVLEFFWGYYPEFDPFEWIRINIEDPTYYYVVLFIVVGVLEEIVKQMMVRYVDSKKVIIQTINDSIRFGIAAALGFAFAENIVYFYAVMQEESIQQIIITFLFRSIFTACGHMVFSGIFGYYFGIAKFTIDIYLQKGLEGKKNVIAWILSRIFRISYSHAVKEVKILQGLIIAIGIHAVFNFLLQLNLILPAIIIVVLGYLYLKYLLQRKAGNLILISDIDEKKRSSMGKKDEDVVLELLGLWFDQKKYVDVMHICERLLERDPDNNVVKLFKAKAMDKLDPDNPYRKIIDTMLGKKRNESEINTITYYRQKKEVAGKNISENKKEKLFRFIDEKKQKTDEVFKLKI
ncbi:PrsW family intramembrane metalloprotease [Candidatus Peregrinibacteria bacterium]|nr:PrsW family intramembrane metalloprotease [Candidatus Peregrinibacteria bacterium]